MKTFFILLILVTSAHSKGIKNFGDFAIDTDVSKLKPDYSAKAPARVQISEEEARRLAAEEKVAEQRKLKAAQGTGQPGVPLRPGL